MEVKILGTRGEIKLSAPRHSNHSGILVDGKLMFDFGEKKFLKNRPVAIFITHLHPDHAFFTRKHTASYPLHGALKEIKIFAPEKHPNCPQLEIAKRVEEINGYRITSIPMVHSKHVKSNAYLIEKGGKRLLYTGDMIWIKKSYRRLLKNIDLVITDGSFLKNGGMVRRDKKTGQIFGHNGMPNLTKFFKKFTNRIVFVHFGSWFYKNKAAFAKLKKKVDITVKLSCDGQKIRF